MKSLQSIMAKAQNRGKASAKQAVNRSQYLKSLSHKDRKIYLAQERQTQKGYR